MGRFDDIVRKLGVEPRRDHLVSFETEREEIVGEILDYVDGLNPAALQLFYDYMKESFPDKLPEERPVTSEERAEAIRDCVEGIKEVEKLNEILEQISSAV